MQTVDHHTDNHAYSSKRRFKETDIPVILDKIFN